MPLLAQSFVDQASQTSFDMVRSSPGARVAPSTPSPSRPARSPKRVTPSPRSRRLGIKDSPRDQDGRPVEDIKSWSDQTLAERYQVRPCFATGARRRRKRYSSCELTLSFERAQFVEEVRADPLSSLFPAPATPSADLPSLFARRSATATGARSGRSAPSSMGPTRRRRASSSSTAAATRRPRLESGRSGPSSSTSRSRSGRAATTTTTSDAVTDARAPTGASARCATRRTRTSSPSTRSSSRRRMASSSWTSTRS